MSFEFRQLGVAANVSSNRKKRHRHIIKRKMKAIKRILPYFLTSILVIGFWKLLTGTDNYTWNPIGKEILMLDIALTTIFIYKTIFWLIVANLIVFAIKLLIKKRFKTAGLISGLTILIYFIAGHYIDRKCAIHYYSVFHNQSVAERYIDRPIKEAGYQIGPILTEQIIDKEMKYRIYAIGGLKKINYKPATSALGRILNDSTEHIEFRADAYEVLSSFDTDETRKILIDFREQSDSIDKKVLELGDYFIKSK